MTPGPEDFPKGSGGPARGARSVDTLIFDSPSPLALWDVAERHVAMFRLTTRRVSELALAYMNELLNVRAGAGIRTQDASTCSFSNLKTPTPG